MGIREHRGAIEAILFASGEPISASRIAEVCELDLRTVKNLLVELANEYENRESGIRILKLGDSYQMSTDKAYADKVRAALDIRRNQPLSQAALEVLAIIAYNQPVTRAFMEQIRGVDCSGVVTTLCEKELIEEAGRLDLPGRPIAFKTTANFMRAFGISSLDMLPALPAEANGAKALSDALTPPAEATGLLLKQSENDEGEEN